MNMPLPVSAFRSTIHRMWPLFLPLVLMVAAIGFFVALLQADASQPSLLWMYLNMGLNGGIISPLLLLILFALATVGLLIVRAVRNKKAAFRWFAPLVAGIGLLFTGLFAAIFVPYPSFSVQPLATTAFAGQHYHLLYLEGGITYFRYVLLDCDAEDILCRTVFNVEPGVCLLSRSSHHFPPQDYPEISYTLSVDPTTTIVQGQAGDQIIFNYDPAAPNDFHLCRP